MKTPLATIIYLSILTIMTESCSPGTNPTPIHSELVYETSQLGFRQAIGIGDLLFISGQVGWTTSYQIPGEGTFEEQFDQSIRNIEHLLASGNCSFSEVVFIRFYVVDMDDDKRAIISHYMKQNFGGNHKPASTMIGIERLARPELMIEIEVMAKRYKL